MNLPILAAVLLLAQFGESPGARMNDAGRVGLQLDKRGGRIVVDSVTENSSAAKEGIQVGDELLRIEFSNTKSMSHSTAAGRLRGYYGTRVTLTVLPRGGMVPRSVEVTRDVRIYAGANAGIVGDVKKPSTGPARRMRIESEVSNIEVSGGDHDADTLRTGFVRGEADVATCVGAIDVYLPNDIEALQATFTFRKEGTVSVRTTPPSADLASCLGKKTAGWKLPKPGKDPTKVTVDWTIDRF